jgi:hypothetical protein
MLDSLSLLVECILVMMDSLSCSFTSIFFAANLLSELVFRAAWVSEWLLFNANSAIFQLYHDENKLIVNEIMYKTNTLSWIFIVLAHWNNNLRVDMSLHSDTLFWIRANQSLLFFLNAACLIEKQQFYSLWFDPTEDRIHANHYATDAVHWIGKTIPVDKGEYFQLSTWRSVGCRR